MFAQGGRTLEGIKVEGGPSAPSGVVTSLSLCETCFRDEQRRFAERGGPPIRLPMGVSPERLEQQVGLGYARVRVGQGLAAATSAQLCTASLKG